FIQTGYSADLVLTLPASRERGNGRRFEWTAEPAVQHLPLVDAACLMETWRSVIEQCVCSAVSRVADIDILLPGERERLLELSGRDIEVAYPFDKTLVDLFEAQVYRTPDAVALSFYETQLTYSELNALANQLAHHLIRRYEIVPDCLIGIELPRSEWIVIGILAIMKSGGAYVPIDPDQPRHRKDYIREDANLRFILDQQELDIFKSLYSQDLLPISDPYVKLTPGNLAYVIYTSGTTGNPKGVLIEHRNVVRLMCNDKLQFDFNERDVWTMAHSYNFDFSVWEMYGALLFGGELVVVPLEVIRDGQAFSQLLVNRGVTVLSQTPSSFYSLSESISFFAGSKRHRIRYVIFGGEALLPTKLSGWFKMYPETRLVNMYGITETTVHVTYKEIGAVEIAEGRSNIGRPIPTLSCYVLDGKMCLCPHGHAGELYVGGAGLARGYLNREELTANKFISSPFGKGERLYRTGDICRWREDGCLEYLGRSDDQVKIRGFRIALGEVASVLLRCEGVREAVVLAEPDGEGSNRLRAWVTVRGGLDEKESAIRSSLLAFLPGYMVPFRIHVIEAIPLTSHGKTDHRALRTMAERAFDLDDGQPLITLTEHKLAALWS
ncbi:MAG: amino acid adenylation domain-containing protein, partial [Acidobacteria bacterium]|nr:amino acid adenylation domain-containing protein [Acidobacteriota bacterium]